MNRKIALGFFRKVFGNKNRLFLKLLIGITFLSANGFAQDQERIINKLSWKNEPIKIVELKTKGKMVELGTRFSEKDDWLKGLTATVKNISDKPISRIELDLSFTRPEGTSEEIPTYAVSMIYGRDPSDASGAERQKQVLPGESVGVKLLEVNLPFIKTDLQKLGYPEEITRTRILVRSVTFNDGTMWDGGDILYPHPTDPKRKYNPQLPPPETLKAPTDQSALSCNSSVTFFQNASFRRTIMSATSSNIFALGKFAVLQDDTLPCNTYFSQTYYPECSTAGSECKRRSDIFEDGIEFYGRRNARKELSNVRCQKDDGTFCTTNPISNFDAYLAVRSLAAAAAGRNVIVGSIVH